ncbi:uncharacterized protein BDR25DRAFT_320278 [Lindgomyces ingoldianus]|uniref:Uncharacterized protein n=1 Tax=Lindgomyces ingoldianus TaxID=673940 RepID=A0ACB6Q819_9PLEO|nr:uncharacterized protein BDR25DRAFT_320278 [Lindgomyces ingoldianus]KAF2463093.1 hypothetical protein BDR25DRAFT_320278 [Lindgomyces ingoldianus]
MAPLVSRSSDNDTSTGGAIAGIVIGSLYILFLVTVLTLIVKNKIQKRRRQKHVLQQAGYKTLGSQIELTAQSPNDEGSGIAQLPTNDEGGEDLTGKPKLEVEGEPIHQLHSNEQPRAPYELQDSVEYVGTNEETQSNITAARSPRVPSAALVHTRSPSPIFSRGENLPSISRSPSLISRNPSTASRNPYAAAMAANDARTTTSTTKKPTLTLNTLTNDTTV